MEEKKLPDEQHEDIKDGEYSTENGATNNSPRHSRPEEYGGDVVMKTPFLTKLENFWYHYKWHTLVSAFVVIVLCICCFQMCSKTDFDVYVAYAGEKGIDRNAPSDGGMPEYNVMLSSFNRVVEDFDGNGTPSTSFTNLYVMSEATKAEIEAATGEKVNESLIATDSQTLRDRLMYSEYYIWFLSEELYEEYKTIDGVSLFTPLAAYLPENSEAVFVEGSNNAVYLSSLDFYTLPGICNLPEDTVVCLRMKSELVNIFTKGGNEENFRRSEQTVKSIFAFDN